MQMLDNVSTSSTYRLTHTDPRPASRQSSRHHVDSRARVLSVCPACLTPPSAPLARNKGRGGSTSRHSTTLRHQPAWPAHAWLGCLSFLISEVWSVRWWFANGQREGWLFGRSVGSMVNFQPNLIYHLPLQFFFQNSRLIFKMYS